MYTIEIRRKDGEVLGDFTNWRSLTFTKRLNDFGVCQFDIHIEDQSLLTLLGLRVLDVYVKRNNTVVWAGEQVGVYGTIQTNSANWFTIIAYDWFEQLYHMYTEPFIRFEQEPQAEILQTLLTNFQNKTDGDLGFTFGTVSDQTLRDREYSNHNLADVWMQMTEVIGGPDFIIKNNKEIDILDSVGADLSASLVLSYPDNIKMAVINTDFSKIANEVIALGAGSGSSQLRAVETDAVNRGHYGLRQSRINETDISILSTLQSKAQEDLRKRKNPLMKVDITQLPQSQPTFGSINLGDIIRVRIKKGFLNINNRFRVYGWENKIQESDKNEQISYTINIL
jgi:hypothetical protein